LRVWGARTYLDNGSRACGLHTGVSRLRGEWLSRLRGNWEGHP